ncbi:anthrone oxygenase family protein [Yoonia sp. SS1-5]|uniref:DUF1772 domain-containing protein n=1 Tax=Yoonia rhodophyticola TaxID=3137370 RepID=A0AAN0NLX2_9RHOB
MSVTFLVLIQIALISYATVGGVFLAFSDFIMRALGRTGQKGGIEAMQIINREVFRWVFMVLFLGLAPISLVLIVYSVTNLNGLAGNLVTGAGLIYLIGCFGVTIRFNVPMNETLGAMALDAAGTEAYWDQVYLPNWTYWNSIRTIACVAASVCLLLALPMLVR